jgi:hypothetical protein
VSVTYRVLVNVLDMVLPPSTEGEDADGDGDAGAGAAWDDASDNSSRRPVRSSNPEGAGAGGEAVLVGRAEEWMVVDELGSARARSMSVGSLRDFRIKPRVFAAARLNVNHEPLPWTSELVWGAGRCLPFHLPVALHVTLLPFARHPNHPQLSRLGSREEEEWNQVQLQALLSPFVRLVEELCAEPCMQRSPLTLYEHYWPSPVLFGPEARCESYQLEWVKALLKELRSKEVFFKTSGERTKLADAMVLARPVPAELRSYLAHHFPHCLQLPLEHVQQLRAVDSGKRPSERKPTCPSMRGGSRCVCVCVCV